MSEYLFEILMVVVGVINAWILLGVKTLKDSIKAMQAKIHANEVELHKDFVKKSDLASFEEKFDKRFDKLEELVKKTK